MATATAIAAAKILRDFAVCRGKSRWQKRQKLSLKSAYFGPISGQIWVKLWDFLIPLFFLKKIWLGIVTKLADFRPISSWIYGLVENLIKWYMLFFGNPPKKSSFLVFCHCRFCHFCRGKCVPICRLPRQRKLMAKRHVYLKLLTNVHYFPSV